ncbi:MAG: GNAT family N-acetyltransferase [Flavobacteriales bacterium]
MAAFPKYSIHIKEFSELNTTELYELIKLRIDVFVVEQDCPYSDLDGKDYGATHLWYASDDGVIMAYARILKPGVSYDEAAIGRVIVAEDFRLYKLGSKLMKDAIDHISTDKNQAIRLSAQKHLEQFYENLSFKSTGKEYLEDGIPHVEMLRPIIS